MNLITFFIIMWAVIGFAWHGLDIEVPKTRLWRALEMFILAPTVAWAWAKIAVGAIMEKINAAKN